MLRFSLGNGRELIAVRPLTQFGRVGPLWLVAALSIWMGLHPGGAFLLVTGVLLAGAGIAGALRVIVLARPGQVRPGLGRRWVPVSSQVRFEVQKGPVGRAGKIVLVGGDRDRTLIVCGAPMWDSISRHESKMTRACVEIARAASPADNREP